TGEIDLSGATIQKPNEKTLEQIIDEFERKVSGVRQGSDQALKTSRDLMARLPSWAVSPLLRATSFLNYTLNLDMTWAGMPKDLFGSVMITNVGSLGLPYALVPLVPYSRVPLLLALGSIEDRAVVEDGELVARKVMDIGATFDHRILDGGHAAKIGPPGRSTNATSAPAATAVSMPREGAYGRRSRESRTSDTTTAPPDEARKEPLPRARRKGRPGRRAGTVQRGWHPRHGTE
ncbi:MAG: 2-oxo acid dehydrogenase subunit E2, partial [Deltaproteobacteria bacterium]|nr:2-oxo acid dehydrogenase subunit E2 [Deltaproteobacteria bacterium]